VDNYDLTDFFLCETLDSVSLSFIPMSPLLTNPTTIGRALDSTMLVKKVPGVLIEKYEKTFDDGGSGYYCSIVKEDETVLSFWCPLEKGDLVGEPVEVEGFKEKLSRNFILRVKEWNGRTKYSLVECE